MADMLFGNGDHQTEVGLAQAAAGVQTVAAGLEQLLTLFLGQGAVLHSLHGLFFSGLFLSVLAGFLVALFVQVLGVAAAVLVLLKGEAGTVLLDVFRRAVLLAVSLQDVGSLGTGMDAAAQFHFLFRAQQRDLADLLEVVLHRVVQQLIHGSFEVSRVLLRALLLFLADAHVIAVVLGVFHLGNDAVHVQAGIRLDLVVQDLDAALLQEGVERFHVHSALCSQIFGLLCRQGALTFGQQFL